MEASNNFYVFVPSNASTVEYKNNKPQSYTMKLAHRIEFPRKYEVALVKISYPHSWFNFNSRSYFSITIPRYDKKGVHQNEASYKKSKVFHHYIKKNPHFKSADQFFLQLPPGYFGTAEDIINEFTRRMIKKLTYLKLTEHLDLFSFTFNKTMQKAKLITARTKPEPSLIASGTRPKPQQAYISLLDGGEHFEALGLFPTEINPGLKVYHHVTKSSSPIAIHASPALYVYCDCVEHQFVGDSLVPLLRTVDIKGVQSELVSEDFIRPFYMPVSKGYISTIQIEIATDSGSLVSFQSGKVICVLHFRQCALPI